MTQTSADDRSRETAGPPAPNALVPDGKDWTWTLRERCPECGFQAAAVAPGDIATRVTAYTAPWPDVLARPGAATRPDPDDLVAVGVRVPRPRRVPALRAAAFGSCSARTPRPSPTGTRTRPPSPSATASRTRPSSAREVTEAAAALAGAYAGVPADAWDRTGLRSNGSEFTVLTLGQYVLHDLATTSGTSGSHFREARAGLPPPRGVPAPGRGAASAPPPVGAVGADRPRRDRHARRPAAARPGRAARPGGASTCHRAPDRGDGPRGPHGRRPGAGPSAAMAQPVLVARVVAGVATARHRHAADHRSRRPARVGPARDRRAGGSPPRGGPGAHGPGPGLRRPGRGTHPGG